MGPITLENVRASSDITVKLRLKDGGMYIAWTSLSDIKAYIFSDAQRAIAGRCDVSIDGNDSTLLICNYSSTKPQYLGVNSIVIRANYDGRVKTYDRCAFNIVKRTADVSEDIVLNDPVVDLELEVADVSSSLLDMAIALAFKAVDEWDQVTVTERGPEGKSAYRVAVDNGFVGTEDEWLASLVGPEGPRGRQGETGETGPAGVTSAVVTVDNTTGTPSATATVENGLLSIAISGIKGETGAAGATGATGPQGPQGIQGIQGETGPQGEEGAPGATGAQGPKGDTGDTPDFSIGTVSTGAAGSQASASITGTAAAPVLNLVIPKGDQGNTGSSVDYPYELVNNRTTNDATKGLSAAEGYRIGQDLTQLEQKVSDFSLNVQEEGFFLVDPYMNIGAAFTGGQLITPTKYYGKKFSFLGDSMTTFGVPDQNNAVGTWTYPGNRCRYPQADLLTDVSLCWWKRLIDKLGATLGINESWAGSRVSNTQATDSGDLGPNRCISSLTRIGHLDDNGTPDYILVYAGANDAGNEVEIGTFDTTNPATLTEREIAALPVATFADAFRALLIRLLYYYPTSKVIVLFPNFTNTYYSAGELDNYVEMERTACDFFGVPWVDLRTAGITVYNKSSLMPDGLHANAAGMELMCNLVYNYLMCH